MLANEDFYQEFLSTLNSNNVEYLIFGGFAVNLYGFSRVTEDLDVWVNPEPINLERFGNAVIKLRFPQEESFKNFVSGTSLMLRLSDESFRVDILTKINIRKTFPEAFGSSQSVDMPYGKIFFIGYDDLIDEKIHAKRPKDLIDVDQLRRIRNEWGKK
jgi:hypothetical protein